MTYNYEGLEDDYPKRRQCDMFLNTELMNKINVGVELIAEGELIYLVASEDKEQKYDITPDAYAAVFRSMAAHAERLGGNCAIAFPGGVLQFKKRDRRDIKIGGTD